MSNRKFVCFSCRTAVRRDTNSVREVLCPECGAVATHVGYKVPLPAKTKVKEWVDLQQQIESHIASVTHELKLKHVQRIHALEKEVLKLESLPANEGRLSLIKRLKRELQNAAKSNSTFA